MKLARPIQSFQNAGCSGVDVFLFCFVLFSLFVLVILFWLFGCWFILLMEVCTGGCAAWYRHITQCCSVRSGRVTPTLLLIFPKSHLIIKILIFSFFFFFDISF